MSRLPDKATLEATLARAAGGDEGAWRAIVEAYSGRVYGLIRAQCGNSDLAEEITQSTFCTVVSRIGGYTERGKFEPWLFRIAMNRLRDEMRRRKRQAKPVEDEALAGLARRREGEEGGCGVDASELVLLRRGLEQLSEADRRIIHLRHFSDLSFKQIAEVLEEPLGTVLARQHRALKKLRQLMARSRDDE